jgi:hypothetical protein
MRRRWRWACRGRSRAGVAGRGWRGAPTCADPGVGSHRRCRSGSVDVGGSVPDPGVGRGRVPAGADRRAAGPAPVHDRPGTGPRPPAGRLWPVSGGGRAEPGGPQPAAGRAAGQAGGGRRAVGRGRATLEPAAQPGADRAAAADRLPRRAGDVGVPRDDLPGPVRAGRRVAAARVGGATRRCGPVADRVGRGPSCRPGRNGPGSARPSSPPAPRRPPTGPCPGTGKETWSSAATYARR